MTSTVIEKLSTVRFTITHLVLTAVFHDLGTQVAAFDRTKVLLVAFAITMILVQHVRRSCLYLRFDNRVPQVLGLDSFTTPAFPLIPAKNRLFVLTDFTAELCRQNKRFLYRSLLL